MSLTPIENLGGAATRTVRIRRTNPHRGWEEWTNIGTRIRPSRIIPEADKGLAYDGECAAFYISKVDAVAINMYREEYAANAAYALGKWGDEQDVRVFLKDNGRSTSKVKFNYPLIQPTLTRLRGAADNLSISPMAIPATQFAETRKEKALMERMAMSRALREGGAAAQAFSGMGVSPDPAATEQIFEGTYQDELIPGINSLMKMIALENGLEDKKREIAKHLALSGLAAIETHVVGNKFVNTLCEPDEVGWDPASIRPDMADGEFVFAAPVMTVQQIAEQYQLRAKDLEEIDQWARDDNMSGGWPGGMPRVYRVYYKDVERFEAGFVDEGGEKVYVPVNDPDPNNRKHKPKYTDKDLVEPPDNGMTADWTDQEWQEKKQTRWREVTRYGVIIPWTSLPKVLTGNSSFADRVKSKDGPRLKRLLNKNGDFVLAGGKCIPQEVHPDDTYMKGFPLKFTTWTRIAGHVVAPLTVGRSPERFMNQLVTDLMWRLRNAGNKSVAIDTDAMAGSTMTEQELVMALKEGKPVNLKGAVVGGLNNAVRDIDTSPSNSFYALFGLVPQVKATMESSVGVFEQNYGAPGSANQLVGTLQLQLQQAGVMQQPFFAAIADLYKQTHQHNAQAGKQFYAERPWALRQLVGDKAAEALIASKDIHYEQFRIEVVLTPNAQEQRIMVDNQIIPMRMQMGLLGAPEAAELMGRSFQSDVDAAGRAYARKMALAQQAAAEQAEQQQAMAALDNEDMALAEREDSMAKDEQNALLKQAQIQQKLQQPYAVNDAKNLDPANDPLMREAEQAVA
ncbi:MAG TPA: hypothetical protein PKJ19_04355 [Flavobacteriales bacterium]|nr:hypothetical protein [Flavobacteriales bacterium]